MTFVFREYLKCKNEKVDYGKLLTMESFQEIYCVLLLIRFDIDCIENERIYSLSS